MKRIEIRIKGSIDKAWSKWFEDLSITYSRNDETILTGTVRDKAALYGLISRLRDLGLTLLSVNYLEKETNSSHSRRSDELPS